MVDILLDSTFLLPTFGVEVEDIRADDLKTLKDSSKKVGLYCSYVSFVEILGKLARTTPQNPPTRAMVKSVFSLILHSPYVALDLSIPIAKKPITPVRRSQIPSTSSGKLLEMHSNIREEVVQLIKDQRFSIPKVHSASGGHREVRRSYGRGGAAYRGVGVPKVK